MPFFKCLCFLTFNLAWLVIGCVLYSAGTSQYSNVIEHETGEWSRGPIVDFVAVSEPQCPKDYEMVSGIFSGTKSYCLSSSSAFFSKPWIGDGFTLGACSKKRKGNTVYGISPVKLNQFDRNYFCVKRKNDLNYHELAKLRSGRTIVNCASGNVCGSATD